MTKSSALKEEEGGRDWQQTLPLSLLKRDVSNNNTASTSVDEAENFGIAQDDLLLNLSAEGWRICRVGVQISTVLEYDVKLFLSC